MPEHISAEKSGVKTWREREWLTTQRAHRSWSFRAQSCSGGAGRPVEGRPACDAPANHLQASQTLDTKATLTH